MRLLQHALSWRTLQQRRVQIWRNLEIENEDHIEPAILKFLHQAPVHISLPGHLGLRKARAKTFNQWWHDVRSDIAKTPHRDPVTKPSRPAGSDRLDFLDASDDVARLEQQMMSRLRQRQAAGVAAHE